jgi:cytochrome c-type biogenesis protein
MSTTGLLLATTDQVQDGSFLVAAPIAFAAGVVSFLSPCVLPLVPAYLSFVTGMSAADLAAAGTTEAEEPRDGAGPIKSPTGRVALGTLGFVAGAAVVFVSFGALFGQAGDVLQEHSEALTQVFGVVTILLGLLLAGAFSRVNLLNREVRIHRLPGRGLLGAPVLGFTFALGWTPCIGPTLGVVLGLAASSDGASAARGAALSVVYCLGLGIPLLITGLAFNRAMGAFAVIKRHYRLLMVGSGAMLVVLGLLQLTGVWTEWMNRLQSEFGGAELPL